MRRIRTGRARPMVGQNGNTFDSMAISQNGNGITPTPFGPGPGPTPGTRCDEKILGQRQDLGDGEAGSPPPTGEFRLEAPGAFCPTQLTLMAFTGGAEVEDLTDLWVTSISSGLTRQLIAGRIPAQMFSRLIACCPAAIMRCLCAPGNPLVMGVQYDPPGDDLELYAILRGQFYDLCDAPAPPRQRATDDVFFGGGATVPAGETVTESISFTGRFCLSKFFLQASATGLVLQDVTPNLTRKIVGQVPIELWGFDNLCCPVDCFDCTCGPGQDLNFVFHNPTDEEISVQVGGVGKHDERC